MPSQETLLAFKEGLKVIEKADDYVTLKDTILRLMAMTSPKDAYHARDAIARVMRKKQATELQLYQGYPQAIANLDQKYKDLYITLKSAKTAPPVKAKPAPRKIESPKPKKENKKKQMVKANYFGGFGPMMILNWLKSKKRTIFLGTALATTVGGTYWLLKYLKDDGEKEKPEEKESGFEKTIKSIQRYRAFTQASKDPDFMGNYEALINGNGDSKSSSSSKKKGKKALPEFDKVSEWGMEEKSLMKSMDSAFHAIATKPEVDYKLPQLPEPKAIDPKEVIKTARGEESEPERPKKKSRSKPKKPESKKTEPKSEPKPRPKSENKKTEKSKPTKKKSTKKKPSKEKKDEEPAGRLVPIVKRTKRVKKVRA